MVDKQRFWVVFFFFGLQCADILEHCLEIIGHLRHNKLIIKLNVKFHFLKVKTPLKLDGNLLELDFFFQDQYSVVQNLKKTIKKLTTRNEI